MSNQSYIYCRKCGNNEAGSFQIHRLSDTLVKSKLTVVGLSLACVDMKKIVRCGKCGHDMVFDSNDHFVRNL